MELTGTATQRFRHRNFRVPIIILLPEHTWNSPEPQRRDSSIGTFELQSSSYCRNTYGTHRNRNAEIHASEPSSSNHNPTAGTHMEITGTPTQRFRHRNLRVPIIILLPEHTWKSPENAENASEPPSSNHHPTAGTHMELTTATQRFRHRNLRVPIIILLPEHTWNSPEPQRRDSSIGTSEFQS